MNSFVVDASVAAAWLLPDEPLIEKGAFVRDSYLRGDIQMFVPDLLFPEIGNVLWKACRRGRVTAHWARESASALLQMQIPTAPSKPLLQDALSFAIATDRSAYDSIYVTLAMEMKIPLLTADLRLVNAIGDHSRVLWLGAFSLAQ